MVFVKLLRQHGMDSGFLIIIHAGKDYSVLFQDERLYIKHPSANADFFALPFPAKLIFPDADGFQQLFF